MKKQSLSHKNDMFELDMDYIQISYNFCFFMMFILATNLVTKSSLL